MKHIFTFIAVLFTVSVFSQTTMNIYQTSGTLLQIPISTIDSVTFSVTVPPPVMNIFQNNGNTLSIAITDIDSITYSGTTNNLPTLTTSSISNITGNSAICGGNITSDGGSSVNVRGVCWNTNPNPTINNYITIDGTGIGSFASNITALTPNTTYYVRAYATNSIGTAYGNQVTFSSAQVSLATVTTANITNIYGTIANGGGNVINDGGGTVTTRGVCWDINPNPTIAIDTTSDGSGTGSFISNIMGLIPNTTHYARAYATNSAGTAYGNEVSFTTGPLFIPGSGVIDIDGNNYTSIIIATQEWMVGNLKTTKYANGDPIPNVTDNNQWYGLSTGAWSWYDNNSQYENPGGKLYNWYAATDPRNACPAGWHVPAENEWHYLGLLLDADSNLYYVNPSLVESPNAGGKMKETGTINWDGPNTNATNESGFTAVGGGFRINGGAFSGIHIQSFFWTSTISPYSSSAGWFRHLFYSNGQFERSQGSQKQGNSIRCIKD